MATFIGFFCTHAAAAHWSGGIPTNIPFLFGNILKRLIKDYQPGYIGIRV